MEPAIPRDFRERILRLKKAMPRIWKVTRAAYGQNVHTYRSPTPHTVYSPPSSDFVEYDC